MKNLLNFALFLGLSSCTLLPEEGVSVTLNLSNDGWSQSATFTVTEIDGGNSYGVAPFGSLSVGAEVEDPTTIPVSVSVGGETLSEVFDADYEGGSAMVVLVEEGDGFTLKGDIKRAVVPDPTDPTNPLPSGGCSDSELQSRTSACANSICPMACNAKVGYECNQPTWTCDLWKSSCESDSLLADCSTYCPPSC